MSSRQRRKRKRWERYSSSLPESTFCKWTFEEKSALANLMKDYGQSWRKAVYTVLSGRSEEAVSRQWDKLKEEAGCTGLFKCGETFQAYTREEEAKAVLNFLQDQLTPERERRESRGSPERVRRPKREFRDFRDSHSEPNSPSESASDQQPARVLNTPQTRDRNVATKDTRGAERKRCSQCHSTRTSQWRKGPNGPGTLCNACGVRYMKAQALSRADRHRALSKPSQHHSETQNSSFLASLGSSSKASSDSEQGDSAHHGESGLPGSPPAGRSQTAASAEEPDSPDTGEPVAGAGAAHRQREAPSAEEVCRREADRGEQAVDPGGATSLHSGLRTGALAQQAQPSSSHEAATNTPADGNRSRRPRGEERRPQPAPAADSSPRLEAAPLVDLEGFGIPFRDISADANRESCWNWVLHLSSQLLEEEEILRLEQNLQSGNPPLPSKTVAIIDGLLRRTRCKPKGDLLMNIIRRLRTLIDTAF